MAVIFSANFDAKTSGVADMASTGATGNQFGPDAGRQHSAVQKVGGAASLYASGVSTSYLQWNYTNTTQIFVRLYFYRASAGSSSATLCTFANIQGNSTSISLKFAVNTGNLVVFGDGAVRATYPISGGQWYRADWIATSPFGSQSVRLYTGATLHSANTADAVAGGESLTAGGFDPLDLMRLGLTPAVTPAVDVYIDEVVADNAALPAPYVPPAPTNDCWVWNGTSEVPANVFVWNGTTEVSAGVSVA